MQDGFDPRGTFLIELARALHEAGVPAHRLEDAVAQASNALDLPIHCLSQPTSLILDVDGRVRVLRVEPHSAHLERMLLIDAIGADVARGQSTPQDGLARLESVHLLRERYPGWVRVVAGAVSSATAAVFFHVSWLAVAESAALGLMVGLLDVVAREKPAYRRVHELVASLAVAAVATALGRVLPVSATVATLAGIISLLPGMTVTIALTELATRHLASGTARLMGAVITLLQLAIGTSLGWRTAVLWPSALRPSANLVPDWAIWAAIPVSAAAFLVTFRARPRDFLWITGVSLLGFVGEHLGQTWLGAELGACVGGFTIGVLSNIQARLRRVPTAITQVPSLLLLVPGAIGFRGLGAMLNADVTEGLGATFSMIVVASALAAGMLASSIVVPPRKTL